MLTPAMPSSPGSRTPLLLASSQTLPAMDALTPLAAAPRYVKLNRSVVLAMDDKTRAEHAAARRAQAAEARRLNEAATPPPF